MRFLCVIKIKIIKCNRILFYSLKLEKLQLVIIKKKTFVFTKLQLNLYTFFDQVEYQHMSTRVNTNQYDSSGINTSLTRIYMSATRVSRNWRKSTRVTQAWHKSSWINTSPKRIKSNQHKPNTSQDDSTLVQHESTRIKTILKQL